MAETATRTRAEIIGYATFLFGSKWQGPLAHALTMDRTDLVRELASNRDLSDDLSSRVAKLKEKYGNRRPAMSSGDVVDFALKIYGTKWQEPLSSALDMERSTVVRLLASDGRLPAKMSNKVIVVMEQYIHRQQADLDVLYEYVENLKEAQALSDETVPISEVRARSA